MIPAQAVEAARVAMCEVTPPPGVSKSEWLAEHGRFALIAGAVAAAAPHMAAASAVSAVLALHRELPCLDEDGDPIGGNGLSQMNITLKPANSREFTMTALANCKPARE